MSNIEQRLLLLKEIKHVYKAIKKHKKKINKRQIAIEKLNHELKKSLTEFFDLNRIILKEKRESKILQKKALSKGNFFPEPIEFFENQLADPRYEKTYMRRWDRILGAYIPEKLDSLVFMDELDSQSTIEYLDNEFVGEVMSSLNME